MDIWNLRHMLWSNGAKMTVQKMLKEQKDKEDKEDSNDSGKDIPAAKR